MLQEIDPINKHDGDYLKQQNYYKPNKLLRSAFKI